MSNISSNPSSEVNNEASLSRYVQKAFKINPVELVDNQDTMTESQLTMTSLSPPYIINMGTIGRSERMSVNFEDITDHGHEEPHFSTIIEMTTKPFHFVNGNVKKKYFNPFRRKSGLLNVMAKRGLRSRLMSKTGALRTMRLGDGKKHKFLKDIFISIIALNWFWIAIIFTATFLVSWLFFAVFWYIIAYEHGDLDLENKANDSFVPCITNIKSFGSTFQFSLETQHTIGYGQKFPNDECPSAAILLSIQSIVGVIINACMAGIIFAKFTVPRNRGQTIVFSKNAVISMRNGVLYLMCRITDLRKYSLLDARVMMVIIRREETDEGEIVPYQQTELHCGTELDGANPSLSIIWPVTVSHKIDPGSPLYQLKPSDLLKCKFEIIVTLIGVTEETGNTIQVRSSYLPNEILWGHRFDNNIMSYDNARMVYMIDHNKLNHTVTDNTPRKSAKYLDVKKMGGTCSEKSSRSNSRVQSTYNTITQDFSEDDTHF